MAQEKVARFLSIQRDRGREIKEELRNARGYRCPPPLTTPPPARAQSWASQSGVPVGPGVAFLQLLGIPPRASLLRLLFIILLAKIFLVTL